VGCFPYMAPEILQDKYYDPQRADIWSLAIMYCCMVLGRFPWKVAASSDEAFSLFTTSQKISISLDRDAHKKELEHVLGPWRLLRLLPSESRAVIEGMLDVNANSRPTLQQISDNAWVKQSQLCSQDDSGTVQCGYGHEHTLRYGQFVISGL
jgi:serine/threonine protein kinase